MPGTPDPVVGSDPLTAVIAALLSLFVVGVFAYAASRSDLSAVTLTGVGAAGYGVFATGLWAGVRLAFYRFALDPTTEPLQFILLVLIAGGLIAGQAAISFYLFARFDFVAPIAGFTAISTLLLFLFLRVGGETDPLGLFGVGFAPVFIGSLLVLAALEAGVRYLIH